MNDKCPFCGHDVVGITGWRYNTVQAWCRQCKARGPVVQIHPKNKMVQLVNRIAKRLWGRRGEQPGGNVIMDFPID